MKKKNKYIILFATAFAIFIGSLCYYRHWRIENEKEKKEWQAKFDDTLRDGVPYVVWAAKNLPYLRKMEINVVDQYYDGYSDINESINQIINQLYDNDRNLRIFDIDCCRAEGFCWTQRKPIARKDSNQQKEIEKHYMELVNLLHELKKKNIYDIENGEDYQKYKEEVHDICIDINYNLALLTKEIQYLNLNIE